MCRFWETLVALSNHNRYSLFLTFVSFTNILIEIKKEKGVEVYFRFLSAQNATMPTTAIMTTAMMASSVVVKANASGSGSIGPAGDGAGSTPMAVSAYELQ